MAVLSSQTLVMAVQAVDTEIRQIKQSVANNISELDPDEQELLMAFSQAAMELKAAYLEAREASPGLPLYDDLVRDD